MKIINQCKIPTICRVDFLSSTHLTVYDDTLSVAIFIHSSKFARMGTFLIGVELASSTAFKTVPLGVRGGECGVAWLPLRMGEPCVAAAATTFCRSRCLLATRSSRRARFSALSSLSEPLARVLWGTPARCVDLFGGIVRHTTASYYTQGSCTARTY